MRTVGEDVYIQRGETWSLDFIVTNDKGDPYMLFLDWKNAYLAITVTAARYAQKGDFRQTWWLDLNQRWVEQASGELELIPMKKFISTEALWLPSFNADEAISLYGKSAGGQMVIDKNSDFDIKNYLFYTDTTRDDTRDYRYIDSYDKALRMAILDYTVWAPGNDYAVGDIVYFNITNRYYIAKVTHTANQANRPPDSATWQVLYCNSNAYFKYPDEFNWVYEVGADDYNYKLGDVRFDAIDINNPAAAKVFYCNTVGTKNGPATSPEAWTQITNLSNKYDEIMHIVWSNYEFRVVKQFNTRDWMEQSYLFDAKVLAGESVAERVYAILLEEGDDVPELPWTDEVLQEQIKLISDWKVRAEMQELFDAGIPLMPTYDTKSLILQPTNLYVSANIQGGIK